MSRIDKTNSDLHLADEQLFLNAADAALSEMEKKANETGIVGVAVLAYVPGERTAGWISRMKVVNAVGDDEANFLAIAYSKASEMVLTHRDSGSESRPMLRGEFAYKGGLIREVRSGYILATFSGAHWTLDLQVSETGIKYLLKEMD
jgi:hypothetical protein